MADFTTETAIVALETGGFAKLSAKDQGFAKDLVSKAKKYGASQKQAYWIIQMAQRASGAPKPQAPQAGIAQADDVADILKLFAKAKQHLKFPKIVLQVAGMPHAVKLSVAGPNAKQPGTINVTEHGAPFGAAAWYGRITQDGTFQQSFKAPAPAALIERLQAFARNPAAVAADHGKLTGKCCFCNTPLSDPKSTAVGYGPICAENFGLPWGEAKTDFSRLACIAA